MSDDFERFLLTCVAEDEAAARDANGRVAWVTLREPNGAMRYTTVAHQRPGDESVWLADGRVIDAEHVSVFYDSARVLAECEAKRRIIEEHSPAHIMTKNDGLNWNYVTCVTCYEPDSVGPGEGYWPCLTMRMLALPHQHHPDFRAEWRPQDA